MKNTVSKNRRAKKDIAYLGVDGGGTYLRASLMSTDGTLLSSFGGPSANPISVGNYKAYENLVSVVGKCISSVGANLTIKGATFALAGLSTRKSANLAHKNILNTEVAHLIAGTITVTNDTFAALWEGATKFPALALVAGTGSHCLGVDDYGNVARASGAEYVLSDEGSAYYLGDRVLRSVTQACDGRGRSTILKELVFSHWNLSSLSELYEYIYSVPSIKQEVASFGEFATKAAELSDEVALEIVSGAVGELAKAVRAVVNKLHISRDQFEIVTIGGVFSSKLVCRMFKSHISAKYPMAILHFEQINASLGAAKIARDKPEYDIWLCYE